MAYKSLNQSTHTPVLWCAYFTSLLSVSILIIQVWLLKIINIAVQLKSIEKNNNFSHTLVENKKSHP